MRMLKTMSIWMQSQSLTFDGIENVTIINKEMEDYQGYSAEINAGGAEIETLTILNEPDTYYRETLSEIHADTHVVIKNGPNNDSKYKGSRNLTKINFNQGYEKIGNTDISITNLDNNLDFQEGVKGHDYYASHAFFSYADDIYTTLNFSHIFNQNTANGETYSAYYEQNVNNRWGFDNPYDWTDLISRSTTPHLHTEININDVHGVFHNTDIVMISVNDARSESNAVINIKDSEHVSVKLTDAIVASDGISGNTDAPRSEWAVDTLVVNLDNAHDIRILAEETEVVTVNILSDSSIYSLGAERGGKDKTFDSLTVNMGEHDLHIETVGMTDISWDGLATFHGTGDLTIDKFGADLSGSTNPPVTFDGRDVGGDINLGYVGTSVNTIFTGQGDDTIILAELRVENKGFYVNAGAGKDVISIKSDNGYGNDHVIAFNEASDSTLDGFDVVMNFFNLNKNNNAVDLSALNLAHTTNVLQKGVMDTRDLSEYVGDGMGFFGDDSVAFSVEEKFKNRPYEDQGYMFVDGNNDGNFTAEEDMVVQFTGLKPFSELTVDHVIF